MITPSLQRRRLVLFLAGGASRQVGMFAEAHLLLFAVTRCC
ncbi:hypothetical protein [Nonomuraea sp. LPB2021202275-12-8]